MRFSIKSLILVQIKMKHYFKSKNAQKLCGIYSLLTMLYKCTLSQHYLCINIKCSFSVMYWVKLLLNFLPSFWNDTINEISVKTFLSCFDTNMLNLWTHKNIFLSYHFKRWKCKSYLFTTSQTKCCSNGNKNNVIVTLLELKRSCRLY